MKKLVLILSAVVFIAATGVLIFGQNAFAEEAGLRFLLPEDLQEVNPGDKVTVSGVIDGVRQLDEGNKLTVRVGRHSLPLNSRRNRFTSEFEVSKTSPRHRRGSRRHGAIYIWGRIPGASVRIKFYHFLKNLKRHRVLRKLSLNCI